MATAGPLTSNVLVLNRFYIAVHVVELRRAFGLLCVDLAEVVHYEDGCFSNFDFDGWREWSEQNSACRQAGEDWIRAVSFEVQAPRVIRLLVYDRFPPHNVRPNRQGVFARDGHQCQYCGRELAGSQLSLDHVIPRSRGGPSTWGNLVCACLKCNRRKGGRTPTEARMRLRSRPKRPQRSPTLLQKLSNPKYASWRIWLDSGH